MPPPAHAPGLVGKTVYHYMTRDGGPPNKGKPPSVPSSGPQPPFPGFPPLCAPAPAPAPGPFFIPPGNGFPGAVCVPNASAATPPPPAPVAPTWFPGAPPAPPSARPPPPAYGPPNAAVHAPEPPVSGNRIKDNLIVVKDSGGHGHVVSKHNATFHLFTYNVIERYTVNAHQQFYIPPNAAEPFRIMTVAYMMPLEELIEQLDCLKDAPGWPRNLVGIAEVFDLGNGWFQVGSKFHLDEERSKLTIKEAWGSSIGEANQSRPRYLVRLPGKQPSGS
jgi:hypothetical protein